jgi:drug/metabolite transporter (DMT)-like permease
MKLTQERRGELFIFLGALLWAFFPVITILSFNKLPALISLGISTSLGALFFAIILSIKKKWHEVKNTSALKDILLVTFILGITYYVLSFFGLKHTSAGNASIIALTEIFFSYVFFHVWRKDYISKEHIIGSILMLSGACIVLYPNITTFHLGDILIVAAAIIAPFGNLFQQKARKKVSSETIMFVRSLISVIFIFFLAVIFKEKFSFTDIKGSFLVLAINGIFLFGLSKLLWIEAIHRVSVTKGNALSSFSILLTLLIAWVLLKNVPNVWQLLSTIPMIFGVILLSKKEKKNKELLTD